MTRPPVAVQLAGCRGRVRRMTAALHGPGVDQADALADCLCLGEELTRTQILNLRSYHAAGHAGPEHDIIAEQLGGEAARQWLFAAPPPRPYERLARRLAAVDARLAERILGHLEAVFVAAVDRTAIKAADAVKRGAASGHDPLEWLDAQPVAVVRSALSDLDEAKVRATVDDLDDLVAAALTAAARDVAGILDDEFDVTVAPQRVMPDVSRDEAVRVAKVSLLALVLGRLTRNDTEVVTRVPPNIARDVLHVAGGADASPAGGVPKSDLGRVLVAGVESVGDGFATSAVVVDEINAASPEPVQTVLVWRHSGAGDANEIHLANDGKRAADCDFRSGGPGDPRNCGCTWLTELEAAA